MVQDYDGATWAAQHKNTQKSGLRWFHCTVHWRFFFVFLKSGQHLRSQTYKWWPIWWLLEEMPSFWWGKGAIPKYPVSVKRTFLFWVCGLCLFFLVVWKSSFPRPLKVVSFPGNAGSHWSADLNWPVVIRAVTEKPRGMRFLRIWCIGCWTPWFLHLQAALTFHQLDPVGQLPSKWYHTMVFHFNFLLLTPCFTLRSAYPSVSTHAPMIC